MNGFLILSYVINIAVFVYAFTRPTSAWLASDRNRGFWLGLIAVFGFMGVLGIVADAAFLIGVLPRMLSSQTSSSRTTDDARIQPNPFTKN